MASAALVSAPAAVEAGPRPERPNFVVIVLDDLPERMFRQSASLRQGSTTAGLEFVNAFAPTPLCCPARSTILTGRYAHSHGVRHNAYKSADLSRDLFGSERRFLERGLESRTVAHRLRRSGYTTSLMGKYLNGYGDSDDPAAPPNEPDEEGSHRTRVPLGWSDWHAWTSGGTNDNGVFRCTGRFGCSAREHTANGRHPTDRLAVKATRLVEAHRGAGRPFFLTLADKVPHRETQPADRHAHSHDGARAPRGASFNEDDTADKPGSVARDAKLAAKGVRPPGCPPEDYPIAYPTTHSACTSSEDFSDHVWESGLEGLETFDDLYDGLVTSLKQNGELDNTYIFLVSDNGLHLGEHRQPYGKNTPYVEDVKIPFTVRGPGIPAGRRLPHLVGLQDIAATVTDLAGAGVPPGMDGRSLRAVLSPAPTPPRRWRRQMLIEGFRGSAVDLPRSARDDTPAWQGLVTRTGRKYAEYATGERELYDLVRDPSELENAAGAAPAAELERLRAAVERLRRCAGTACRGAEDE